MADISEGSGRSECISFEHLTVTASHFTERYQPGRERAWHLSIWSAPHATAWCVHDITNGSVAGLASGGSDQLPEAERLPKNPASISFIALPEISTLVPEGVLEGGREAAHLELVHGALPTGLLRDEPIDALSARCIYLHDEAVEKRLLHHYPSARPIALQALLIKTAMARAADKPLLLIHRAEQRCDLVIADRTNVRLANSFHAPTATDVLYFTLFALDRSGLKPEEVQALVGGMALSTEVHTLLEGYLPDLGPAIQKNATALSGLSLARPEHFTALLEQWPCAL